MSRTIPVTPHCAARSSLRLELRPSGRFACAWFLWLLVLLAAVFAAPLPAPARIGLGVAVATMGIRCVVTVVLLRGPRAVHRLDRTEDGEWRVYLGDWPVGQAASVAPGSFRLGTGLLLLRLETGNGIHTVCIDGARQDRAAFRRLCRFLRGHEASASPGDS